MKNLLIATGLGYLAWSLLDKGASGKPRIVKGNKIEANVIAAQWSVRGDYLWTIFGIESSFGNQVINRPGDGEGPMQILPSTRELLLRRFPQLASKDVETFEGAFHYAAAHIVYTSQIRGWERDDLRNIVAYNEGPNGANTYFPEYGLRLAMQSNILDSGIPYFNKFRDIYLGEFGNWKG